MNKKPYAHLEAVFDRYFADGGRAAFADQLGLTIQYFSNISHGRRQPSIALARRISEASGGAITVADLRPEIADLMR